MNAILTVAVCRTCNRPLSAPWRSRDAAGAIRNGCVAVDHDGHLTDAADVAWHERDEARELREDSARHLSDLLGIPIEQARRSGLPS